VPFCVKRWGREKGRRRPLEKRTPGSFGRLNVLLNPHLHTLRKGGKGGGEKTNTGVLHLAKKAEKGEGGGKKEGPGPAMQL